MARKSNTSTTEIDKSSYFFTFQCGICHPGGAATQYDRNGFKYFDDATQTYGYGATATTPGVAALPTEARLDGDYAFVTPGGATAGTPGLANNWKKNGVLEADCLLCHLQGYSWKNRAATLVGGQGMSGVSAFRVAPVMGAGWGSVTIAAAPAFPPTASAVGTVDYELGIASGSLEVGAGNQLIIKLDKVGPTPEANCRGCHSTPDTKKSGRTLNDANDVHKAGGVGCTECHPLADRKVDGTTFARLEHQIGKGDVVIGSVRNDLDNTVRSCEACHMHGESPLAPDPTAAHRSLRHVGAMKCQACHIRYLEDDATVPGMQAPELVIEMTSNGTQTVSTWDKYFPSAIAADVSTVYRWYPALRSYKGKLTTVKPLLTPYFGDWQSGTGDGAIIRPIPLRMVRKALTGLYAPGSPRVASLTITPGFGGDPANPVVWKKSEIQALLVAVRDAVDTANPDPTASNDIAQNPVIVRAGKIYYLNAAGEVEWFHSAVAESHDFSINHNVVPKRDPANPVLKPGPYGAGGCGDCHSPTSTFFFAKQLVEPAQYEFLDEHGTVPNPDAGKPKYVEHWEAMGYSASRVAALTGNMVPVRVDLSGTGVGSTVTGAGIDCGYTSGSCTTVVSAGGALVLTANPVVGFGIQSWSGCTPSADLLTCSVDVGAATALGGMKIVRATFGLPAATPAPTTSGVMVSIVGTGWGYVTGSGVNCTMGTQGACNATIPAGQTVILTATPGPNTTFSSWTGCTAVSGAQCTVDVNGVSAVKATFSNGTGGGQYSETQALIVNHLGTGFGVVTGAGFDCATSSGGCRLDLATGSSATLTATPASGSAFVSWTGCTSASGTTCTVTNLTAPKVVTVTWQKQ